MLSTPVLVPVKLWNKTALLSEGLISATPLVQVETNEELIELWLANKKSRHTRRAYQQDIDYFLGFIENKPLPLVTGNDLIAYKQALERSLNQKKAGETISPNTVARRLLGVRSLFSFACDKARLLPFSSYKSISAVAKKFQLKYVLSDYIVGIELPVKAAFKEELDLLFTDSVEEGVGCWGVGDRVGFSSLSPTP
ncbi:site-specific integrase [Floridanema evergladense]|uniref:Site-specific integrase n=1 Tax=Floridaenema evergladense BLCC-F167 TaxID=3153639 RepID=A0ABV4WHN7_9CYAN